MDEVCLSVDELKALGEASFAKELAFQVAPDADLATRLLILLLNDRLLRRRLYYRLIALSRDHIHILRKTHLVS